MARDNDQMSPSVANALSSDDGCLGYSEIEEGYPSWIGIRLAAAESLSLSTQ